MEHPAERRRPFRGPSFGITHKYVEKVTYEEIFYLMKECNFTFSEAYSLPVGLRKWFTRRTAKYLTPQDQE